MKQKQEQVHKWVSQFETPYWKPHEILSRIIEEVGEISREINHLYGPKKKKSTEQITELGDEISDTIFALICLANSQKIDLDLAFDKMMNKIQNRDNNRFQKI